MSRTEILWTVIPSWKGHRFKSDTQIHVGKFYTVAYFGPFRDENTVESKTNEQIGANHIISKTGGNGFTKEQLKQLTKVAAKDKTGNDLEDDQISFLMKNRYKI